MSNREQHRPTVSVCLPVYNGRRYLASAIQSILSQSLNDFELIVIDDCSDDDSWTIANNFAETDSRVSLQRNAKRLGPLANFNHCFKQAEGRYIKPFSQDDLLHSDMLRKCVETMELHPDVALLSVSRSLIDSNGEFIRSEDLPNAGLIVEPMRAIGGKELFGTCVNPLINYIGESSTVMFRRSVAGGGFDSKFSQLADLELWLRVLMNGKFLFIPDTLCHVRCHPNSVTAKDIRSLRLLTDFVRFRKKYASDLQQFNDSFIENNVTWLSRYYQALIDQNILSPGALDTPSDEAGEYLELALHALTKIARDSGFTMRTATSTGRSHNERLIEALEREVQVLLSSRSWRITKLLRDFSSGPTKVSSAAEPESKNDLTDPNSFPDDVGEKPLTATFKEREIPVSSEDDEQLAYIGYLREQIIQIKMSRSWTITRPLRIIESALKTH